MLAGGCQSEPEAVAEPSEEVSVIVTSKAETMSNLKDPIHFTYYADVPTEYGDFNVTFKQAREWHADPELDDLYQKPSQKLVVIGMDVENVSFNNLEDEYSNGLHRGYLKQYIYVYDQDGYQCEQIDMDPLEDGIYVDTMGDIAPGTKKHCASGFYIPENTNTFSIVVNGQELGEVTIR